MTTPSDFSFTPTDGLRNPVSFPTKPATEADARNQVQSISDQIKDWLNDTLLPALGTSMSLTGATAPTRYVGGTTSGAPTTGTFAVGDFVIAQNGVVWICATAGTPGTWIDSRVSTQPNFIAPTLQNGWVNYGGTTVPARYYKNTFGDVVIQGNLANGTTAGGTIIFTLPSGYRPAYRLAFDTRSSNGSTWGQGGVFIEPTGEVKVDVVTGNSQLLINIPPFRAEQ